MGEFVKLSAGERKALHEQNPAMMSYNVEFAEVTGGTFWKAYTPGQIAGTEDFNVDMSGGLAAAYKDLMQIYPPINLYDEKNDPTYGMTKEEKEEYYKKLFKHKK